MFKKVVIIVALLSLCGLIVIIQFVRPSQAGPLGILLALICIYLTLVGVTSFAIYAIGKCIPRFSKIIASRKPIQALPFKKSYYFGSIVSLGSVMILAVQSVGSLDVYTTLLVLAFVGTGCAYIARQVA